MRHFLTAAGLTLTLPAWRAWAAQDLAEPAHAKRLFLLADGYGFHTPFFYPKATGADHPTDCAISFSRLLSLRALRDATVWRVALPRFCYAL